MTDSRTHKRIARGAGAAGVAVLLLLGSGCGGGGGGAAGGGGGGGKDAARGNAPAAVNQQQSAAIPVAGDHPTGPAPAFTSQAPSLPAGGVSIEELYQQGKTEVIP